MNATPVASVVHDDPYTDDLAAASERTTYDKDYLRKLARSGKLHGVQKKNRRWHFRPEDLDALVAPKVVTAESEQERLLEEFIRMAPRFSPARKARIAAALAGSSAEEVA